MTLEHKERKNSSLNNLTKITKRSDYLRASQSKYLVSKSFILQFHNRKDSIGPRYGITVTKNMEKMVTTMFLLLKKI